MFQVGDQVVYGNTGVCRVAAVGEPGSSMTEKGRAYYTLEPVYGTETIYLPVDTKASIRPVLTAEEAELLIRRMPDIQEEQVELYNTQTLSRYYQEAFRSHDTDGLVRLLKTIHGKDSAALQCGKKPGKIEERYRKLAEDLLYGELAAALEIPRDDVQRYINRLLGGEDRNADSEAETA